MRRTPFQYEKNKIWKILHCGASSHWIFLAVYDMTKSCATTAYFCLHSFARTWKFPHCLKLIYLVSWWYLFQKFEFFLVVTCFGNRLHIYSTLCLHPDGILMFISKCFQAKPLKRLLFLLIWLRNKIFQTKINYPDCFITDTMSKSIQ